MKTALSLSHVTKRFGDFTAVDDVSLSVLPGEIFALLGPNGAGKTTLISSIAGVSRQSSGEIRVLGHDTIKDFRTTRRLIGLVPQEINFDPFFTPEESLMIQMGFMGLKPDPDRVTEVLRMVSLLDKRNAYSRTLSGGMKRRVLVAKALVHRPKLLFLDEPTAGVDVELRKELWQTVRTLRDQGTTIVLTTHYLEEAEELADRIGILHRGKLLLVQDRTELMTHHGASKLRMRFRKKLDLGEKLKLSSKMNQLDMVQIDDRTIDATYNSPSELQNALISAQDLGGELLQIEVRQRKLEDIFVELIQQADLKDSKAKEKHV